MTFHCKYHTDYAVSLALVHIPDTCMGNAQHGTLLDTMLQLLCVAIPVRQAQALAIQILWPLCFVTNPNPLHSMKMRLLKSQISYPYLVLAHASGMFSVGQTLKQ